MEWTEEQKKVIEAKGNTIVSASAGSGKTTVLIGKIMELLKKGQKLDRILLMTFSRASAQDMKAKLVKNIYDALDGTHEGEALRKALEQLPFSNISTINSFCYTLLKKYFSVVKQDPSCAILDENESKLLKQECLDKVIEQEISAKNKDFLRTLSFFKQKRSNDAFKEEVCILWDYLSVQEKPDAFLSAFDNKKAVIEYYLSVQKREVAFWSDSVRGLLNMLAIENYGSVPAYKKDYDLQTESYRENLLCCNRAADAIEKGDILAFFGEISRFVLPARIHKNKLKSGTVSEELYNACGEVRTGLKEFKEDVEKSEELYREEMKNASSQFAEVVSVMLRVYKETVQEYAMRKKARAVVDFNDAERAAIEILENADIREEIQKSFDYVFIDEYQDTNYLQEALLNAVSTGNNLFTVGDMKQAIYRFRYAEPNIFRDRYNLYDTVKTGKTLLLNGNFRSCDEVLEFTNDVCAEVMTTDFGGVDYKNSAMLVSGRSKKGEGVFVYTYDVDRSRTAVPEKEIYRVRGGRKEDDADVEAKFVAQEILSYVGKPIVNTEKEGKRNAEYKDFAILVRKSAHILPIIEALKAEKIPYFVSRDQKTDLPQREALVNCLRVILNDSEDIPLAHVMTEIFGVSDQELLSVKTEKPNKTFSEAAAASTNKKVRRMFECLKKWREYIGFMAVDDLMREILSSVYDARLLSYGEEIVSQINAFILYVGQQCQGMTVREFIRYYDEVYQGNLPPAPPSAVTVMTMHASKGLQFPIVLMPYLSGKFRENHSKIICDKSLGVAVPKFDEETSSSAENFTLSVLKLKKRIEGKEDEARLMYVGFTRAQDCLILTGEKKNAVRDVLKANCVMDWLCYTRSRNGKFADYFGDLVVLSIPSVKPIPEQKPFDASLLKWKYPYQKATETKAKTTVSDILNAEHVKKYRKKTSETSDGNAEKGTAMHAVLQYVDFRSNTPEKVALELVRLQNEGLITEEQKALCDVGILANVLSSDVIREIAEKRYEVKREYSFVAYIPWKDLAESDVDDKVLVQGVLDLLVFLPNGKTVLIDYKTSTLGAEKLKERYAKQLELYEKAVESILKKQVERKILFNVLTGECVEIR